MGTGKKVLGSLVGTAACIGAVAFAPITAPVAGAVGTVALVSGGIGGTTAIASGVAGGFLAGCIGGIGISKAVKNSKEKEKEMINKEQEIADKAMYNLDAIIFKELKKYCIENKINLCDYIDRDLFNVLNDLLYSSPYMSIEYDLSYKIDYNLKLLKDSKKYIKETYAIFGNIFNFLEEDNFELNYNLKLIKNKFENYLK